VSAVFQDPDETLERALFERRARARATQDAAGVPSLDAVLRAAGPGVVERSSERSSGRKRAWGGLALAAACLLMVMKARPGDVSRSTHPTIVAEAAGPMLTTDDRGAAAMCTEPEVTACALDTSCSGAATERAPVAAPEDHTCTDSPKLSTSADTLACDADDVIRTDNR